MRINIRKVYKGKHSKIVVKSIESLHDKFIVECKFKSLKFRCKCDPNSHIWSIMTKSGASIYSFRYNYFLDKKLVFVFACEYYETLRNLMNSKFNEILVNTDINYAVFLKNQKEQKLIEKTESKKLKEVLSDRNY